MIVLSISLILILFIKNSESTIPSQKIKIHSHIRKFNYSFLFYYLKK